VNILSAGVIANFFVAIVAFLLLFGPVLGAIAASDGEVIVYNVAPGSLAAAAGIKPNMIIASVDGHSITSTGQLDDYLRAHPDTNVTIAGLLGGKPVDYSVHVNDAKGVYILGIINDKSYPAAAAGIEPNMRLVAINGTPIADTAAFNDYMNATTAGQAVTLGLVDMNGTAKNATVILASGTGPKGYVGFTNYDLSNNMVGISYGTFANGYLSGLRNMPFSVEGWLRIMILPVLQFSGSDPGFSVFTGEFASLFHPVGWAAPFGTLVYGLTECLFWIGWLNFNVGLFNCLPMIPLDGGHIFREATRTFMGRFVKDKTKAERISKAIVNGFAVTLLASIIFMFMAPYFVQWLMR
jgi:membrane-associated protease RseP (regulator of RpoE activity)